MVQRYEWLTGEPDAMKVARPVREEVVGSVPHANVVEGWLSTSLVWFRVRVPGHPLNTQKASPVGGAFSYWFPRRNQTIFGLLNAEAVIYVLAWYDIKKAMFR